MTASTEKVRMMTDKHTKGLLIAAAPDLKAALIEMMYATRENRTPEQIEARRIAIRALDKSEGRGV